MYLVRKNVRTKRDGDTQMKELLEKIVNELNSEAGEVWRSVREDDEYYRGIWQGLIQARNLVAEYARGEKK